MSVNESRVQLDLKNRDQDHAKRIARRNPDKNGIVQMKEARDNRIAIEEKLIAEFLKEKEVLIHKDQTLIYDYLKEDGK